MNGIQTVGIVSPGDMGHVVGRVLGENGLQVITALHERSRRTQLLAREAGIEDVGSYEALVSEADAILAILVPAEALSAARRIAAALQETGRSLLYVDCNAVSPQTAREIGAVITAAGGRCLDASIVGPPPRTSGTTRFYASGPHVEQLAQLNSHGLHVIPLGPSLGAASAIKMCYAALTKGLSALAIELLVAARALDVLDPLLQEFQWSQSSLLERLERGLPNVPPKARRWVGEMEEIASTFADVGLTPRIHEGAAEIYRFLGATDLADRNPEDPEPPPDLPEMLDQLARRLREVSS